VQPSPTASWKDEHETGEPGPPKTQAEAAYRHLRRDIRAGLLAPRRWLWLTELRETYGFGWSPLREALFLLTAENLVVAEGQRGFRVAPISEADFDDLLTLRNKLEDEALRVSIALGDDAWEAAIVAALHRIRKLPPDWENHRCSGFGRAAAPSHLPRQPFGGLPVAMDVALLGSAAAADRALPAHRAASRRSACGRRGGNPARPPADRRGGPGTPLRSGGRGPASPQCLVERADSRGPQARAGRVRIGSGLRIEPACR
jgi:Bacterial regulatory proteins, gntR family